VNDREILGVIVKALKLEALSKPDEKIYVGSRVYTYREFAGMLNDRRKLDKTDRRFVESFLKTSVKMFKKDQSFRERMLRLAGEG
jgi:hypothetical protein